MVSPVRLERRRLLGGPSGDLHSLASPSPATTSEGVCCEEREGLSEACGADREGASSEALEATLSPLTSSVCVFAGTVSERYPAESVEPLAGLSLPLWLLLGVMQLCISSSPPLEGKDSTVVAGDVKVGAEGRSGASGNTPPLALPAATFPADILPSPKGFLVGDASRLETAGAPLGSCCLTCMLPPEEVQWLVSTPLPALLWPLCLRWLPADETLLVSWSSSGRGAAGGTCMGGGCNSNCGCCPCSASAAAG